MDDAHILSFTEPVCLLPIQLICFILTADRPTLDLDEAVQSYEFLPLDMVVVPFEKTPYQFSIMRSDVHD